MAPTTDRSLARRPDISNIIVRNSLDRRPHPYWWPLMSGRFIGYSLPRYASAKWVARYRDRHGDYHQRQIGIPDDLEPANDGSVLSFKQALERSWQWFTSPDVAGVSNDPKPFGRITELLYTPIGELYTLGHALHEYLEWKRLRSAQTHYNVIVSLINYHILPRLGPLALEDLRGEHIRDSFLEVLETEPRHGGRPGGKRQTMSLWDDESLRKRKKTVNALSNILRDTLQRAWEDGKTDNDRLWRSLRNIPNVDRPRIMHLSRPECRRLLHHCRPDLRNLVLGALYTGCRTLELLRMKTVDVGRDGYGVYVAPSKTRKHRFVFLPDEGVVFFLKLIKGKAPHAQLFTRADGRAWGEYHRHLLRKAARDAGLDENFSFHGLRHTYASQLVQAGAPLTVVAEQLGHANTVSVSRTYGHISPQIREAEVRQRFTALTGVNAQAVKRQKESLARWRASMHGSNWQTYAKIQDLKSRTNTER
jgi:integrase/recombinase XerD